MSVSYPDVFVNVHHDTLLTTLFAALFATLFAHILRLANVIAKPLTETVQRGNNAKKDDDVRSTTQKKEEPAMSLLRHGKAQALTIYLGESDQWQGKSLYVEIVRFLREQGCAGATVSRAVAGYGASSHLHTGEGWHWSSDASVIIQVIDQPNRLHRVLPHIEEMMNGGLITLSEVEVLKYTHARSHGLPTKLPVRQVMETSITTVHPDTPIATVIDLLLEASFRALPVVDSNQKLQGIIGTRDLISAGVLPVRRGLVRTARELDDRTAQAIEASLEQARQSDRTAQDVMNRHVRTVGPDVSIREAAQILLETGLRRLPVIGADKTLLGMLTRADLLQLIVTSPLRSQNDSSGTQPLSYTKPLTDLPIQQQPISAYMTTEVPTVGEQTPLAQVIDALVVSPLKRVIVLDEQGRVKGIIGDVDVLTHMQEDSRTGLLGLLTNWTRAGNTPTSVPSKGKARTAADIMNRKVVTVTAATSVQETIERMMATGRKVLPVIDTQGHLQGVVGRSDVLRILIEE